MRGSSVTSSGSQSPIFLVMFLNGRIHYAGSSEWEEAASAARSIASTNGSFCRAERGTVEPKEDLINIVYPPRATGSKRSFREGGKVQAPRQILIVSLLSLRPPSLPARLSNVRRGRLRGRNVWSPAHAPRLLCAHARAVHVLAAPEPKAHICVSNSTRGGQVIKNKNREPQRPLG